MSRPTALEGLVNERDLIRRALLKKHSQEETDQFMDLLKYRTVNEIILMAKEAEKFLHDESA